MDHPINWRLLVGLDDHRMQYLSKLEFLWVLHANYSPRELEAKHDSDHPQIPSLRKGSNVKRCLMTNSNYKRFFIRECFLCSKCHFEKSLPQKESSR
jgi:hypothetical protein